MDTGTGWRCLESLIGTRLALATLDDSTGSGATRQRIGDSVHRGLMHLRSEHSIAQVDRPRVSLPTVQEFVDPQPPRGTTVSAG
jgi:hypothetical protein